MKKNIFLVILLILAVISLWAQDKVLEVKKPLGEEEHIIEERTSDQEIQLKVMLEKANSGDAYSQFKLGQAYYYGTDLLKNTDEAVKWFKASADQGSPEGQTALGICYLKGEGVAQDNKQAIALFQAAAKQNYPEAQFQMGVMSYGGEGIPANNKEAAKWFRLAAEQGHCLAQSNLGICYYEGTGVRMDNLESYYWLSLAAHLCPPQYADEYNKTRDKVKAELKADEIAKADQRVLDWMHKNKQ